MRSAAVSGVLVVAGCNPIFGLDETSPLPPPDAKLQRVALSQQVALMQDDSRPVPELVLEKVEPAPIVRVGPLDGTLLDTGYVDPGEVEYPDALVGNPWRLEYQQPDGVAHEVQWTPPAGGGHLVVPIYGRTARTPAPAGSGYRVALAGYTFSERARVFTTGYWTMTTLPAATAMPAIDLTRPPLSGPLGIPGTTDFVVALDYAPGNATTCSIANRAGIATLPAMQAGAMVDVALGAAPLFGRLAELAYASPVVDHATRLDKHLHDSRDNSLGRSGPTAERVFVGQIPHPKMFGFTHAIDDVPAPLLVPMIDCPIMTGTTPSFTAPTLDLPGAMFAYVANARVGQAGTALTSSIAGLVTMTRAGDTYNGTVDLRVPLATAPITLGDADLANGADLQDIKAERAELRFAYDTDAPDYKLDYVEVTLYRVTAGALVPVRVYTLTEPERRTLMFDPSVMTAGDEHVFAIRTYRGRPDVRAWDFRRIEEPQAVATIFTRTFRRL